MLSSDRIELSSSILTPSAFGRRNMLDGPRGKKRSSSEQGKGNKRSSTEGSESGPDIHIPPGPRASAGSAKRGRR
jgi:hypothetical protein